MWPRIIQIAWIIHDIESGRNKEYTYLIQPNGFTIPEAASRVHGITTDTALKNGVPIDNALKQLLTDALQTQRIIGHNQQFDQKTANAELKQSNLPPNQIQAWNKIQRICTMKSTTSLLKLPGPYGYKWPKLQELHKYLFGEEFVGAHDALVDVRATLRCYLELLDRGFYS